MLISGLKSLKSRIFRKDNYVKKYGITNRKQEELYTCPFRVKSFPHRINMVVHMKMLIIDQSPGNG